MKIKLIMASAAMMALAACGDGTDNVADNMAMNDVAMDPMAADSNAISDPIPANGQQFAMMAAASDMYEIEAGRLAAEKSQNAGIKELAAMIVTDHEKATAGLKTAAAAATPAITVTPAMNPEQTAMIAALRSANGTAFDRAYIDQQVMAHQKALTLLQGYSVNGEMPGLKAHAAAATAPVQQHLERAQQLQQQLPQ